MISDVEPIAVTMMAAPIVGKRARARALAGGGFAPTDAGRAQ